MLESIGGGGDAGLGDAALVDSVYGLNALRAMCEAVSGWGRASERAIADAAASSASAATAAVEALLPPTVDLGTIAAGVAAALEHLPPSLSEDANGCVSLLLEAAEPEASGEVRVRATRRLLEVTAGALGSMDLGDIGPDDSLPGLALSRRPNPSVSEAKLRAAAATGVKKFLNRLLGKRIEVQVVVFAFFMACLEAKILMAKRAGTFDAGVSKITGTPIPESSSSFGAVSAVGVNGVTTTATAAAATTANSNVPANAAKPADVAAASASAPSHDEIFRLLWRERQPPHRELRFVELRVDRGVSFEAAMARLRAQLPKPHPEAKTGFFVSRRRIIGPHYAVLLALVRGYSAPVGAAAAADAAADAAAEAAAAAAAEAEVEVAEAAEEEGGVQLVGAGNNNFYSAAQQQQHGQQRQQRARRNKNYLVPYRPSPSKYLIIRPNTGATSAGDDMLVGDLLRIYEPVPPEQARMYWEQAYERTERGCAHGPGGCQVPNCTNGTRMSYVCVLSGAVVRLWRTISDVAGPDALKTVRATVPAEFVRGVSGSSGANSNASTALAVAPSSSSSFVSPTASASRTIVGVRFPAHKIPELRMKLEVADGSGMEGGGGGSSNGRRSTAAAEALDPYYDEFHDEEDYGDEDDEDDEGDDGPSRRRRGNRAAAAAAATAGAGARRTHVGGVPPPPPPEPPAPVDPARLRRLTRPPSTITSMFAAAAAASGGRGRGSGSSARPSTSFGGFGVHGGASSAAAAERKRKRREDVIDTIMTVTNCSYAIADEALRLSGGGLEKALELVLDGKVGQ